jgi:hypothetical protein
MCGQFQRDLIKANINVQMVITFLGFPGDPFDKSDAFQEPVGGENSINLRKC